MSWKKFFIGESVPDKNDPKYRERYEREKAAGEKFARVTGLATIGAWIHRVATAHKVGFLVLVFSFVILLFVLNVVRMFMAYHEGNTRRASAVEQVDSAIGSCVNHRQTLKMTDGYD